MTNERHQSSAFIKCDLINLQGKVRDLFFVKTICFSSTLVTMRVLKERGGGGGGGGGGGV